MSKTYTPESILAALENGKTSDELANEFTKALNDALELQEKKEKEKAAAEEARRKADEARAKAEADKARKRKQQEADTEDLVDHFCSYIEEYYPSYELKGDFSAAKVIELFDSFADLNKVLKELPKFEKIFTEEPSWFNELFM